ncbi:MAG: NrdH-redoxin, partial [Bacteroidota bacterium]
MKQIHSLNDLTRELQTNGSVWLLLHKKGSVQSECALNNYEDAVANLDGQQFLHANVNEVRDIHPEYGIQSVPTLLEFHSGTLTNIIKGCH